MVVNIKMCLDAVSSVCLSLSAPLTLEGLLTSLAFLILFVGKGRQMTILWVVSQKREMGGGGRSLRGSSSEEEND